MTFDTAPAMKKRSFELPIMLAPEERLRRSCRMFAIVDPVL